MAQKRGAWSWCEVCRVMRARTRGQGRYGAGAMRRKLGLVRDHKHTRKHTVYDSEGFWITISRYSLSARDEVKVR